MQSVERRRRAAVALVAADVALVVGMTLGRLTARVPQIDGLSRAAFDLGLTLHRWALKELKAGW